MDTSATPAFAAWAKSYSGFDGGNIRGKIWFCGFERGGSTKRPAFSLTPVTKPPYISSEQAKSWGDNGRHFLSYPYNCRAIKLYASILNRRLKDYKKVFDTSKAFEKRSDVFKLNLYPIAFRQKTSSWDDWLCTETGFHSKASYQSWCQTYRFPVLRKWAGKYRPAAIICTGTNDYREFFSAFLDKTNASPKMQIARHHFYWERMNNHTTVFVIPFLGRGGLLSDDHLSKFGKEIARTCQRQFGEEWCEQFSSLRT